ncbi:sigma-70 family RNA polymerase sigma factor [Microbacterium sp. Mu-80]|uniref:Sigma-70 family RNA polymerase sigma factor n=1 Tax=Microbacterium bandirmense TaxID=3122050 RepID=A0ABU8LCZ9_9MICO
MDSQKFGASSSSGNDSERRKAAVYRLLFDENWPRVRRFLDCYLDDDNEVEEITAEVFVIAWRKLKPDAPMGLTWFLRTANNKLRDRSRRAKSRARALEALTRSLENPAEPLDPLEALALRTALRTLSAREQQVVVLTYWNDLSAGEVAEVLHSSQGAVWATLTRARAKLRAQLEEKAAPR